MKTRTTTTFTKDEVVKLLEAEIAKAGYIIKRVGGGRSGTRIFNINEDGDYTFDIEQDVTIAAPH